MATPADLIAAAGAAGAAPRRPAARPMTATVGSAPGGVATLDAGAPSFSTSMPSDLNAMIGRLPPELTGLAAKSFPGFRPMGGGMPSPPIAAPQMAQGREVVEQGGQKGVMGSGGNFQPLGGAALGHLGDGGALRPAGTFGGGSGGIIAEEDGGGMPGFRTVNNPYGRPAGRSGAKPGQGGATAAANANPGAYIQPADDTAFLRDNPGAAKEMTDMVSKRLGPSGAISNSGEIQGDGARGMSSIGSAVGRAMRPRPMRSAVSREGAAPGY